MECREGRYRKLYEIIKMYIVILIYNIYLRLLLYKKYCGIKISNSLMKNNVLLTYYENGDTVQLELTTQGIPQKLFTYIFVRLV